MPFTAAHPLAVIPVHRWLQRWTLPSALVIGSITPDLSYALPFRIARTQSHSIPGLVWFCLPVGCAAYVIFHLALKYPLISLAPARFRERLGSVAGASRRLPSVSWSVVLTSLLLGAATHVAWDSFTHGGGLPVRMFDVLRVPVFAIGSHEILAYRVLQHVSTLVGLVLLWRWVARWLNDAAIEPVPVLALTPSERLVVVATLMTVPVVWGLVVALSHLLGPINGSVVHRALARGFKSSLAASGMVLLGYSAWWYLWWSPRSAEASSSRR